MTDDPMNDPTLLKLIELQRRIETLGQLSEQLAVIIEQQFAMMRAMLAGEAPPPPPPAVN
jgi:hypothetical protein